MEEAHQLFIIKCQKMIMLQCLHLTHVKSSSRIKYSTQNKKVKKKNKNGKKMELNRLIADRNHNPTACNILFMKIMNAKALAQ